MLSVNYNFLFIHVPKTASNTIQGVLKDYSENKIVCLNPGDDGIERYEVRDETFKDIRKHSTITLYKKSLPAYLFNKLFKFATVRNPWDRLISLYFSPHRGKVEWNRNDFIKLLKRTPTLRSYVTLPRRFFSRMIMGGQCITRDRDYLMKFEDMDNDFKKVCAKIGIPFVALPRRNVSKHEHYSRYYDKELIAMVREKYAEEIQWGEYEFNK
jgi:hypothetical protein